MRIGGQVLLRSAGLKPWYIASFSRQGFKCQRVAARTAGRCIDRSVHISSFPCPTPPLLMVLLRRDRVNMYASTWICTKDSADPTAVVDDREDSDAGIAEVVEEFEL